MMNFFKKLFGKSDLKMPKEFSEHEHKLDYELKSKGLEALLGKMHDFVGHSIIPFAVGGAVHMYYFTNHITGTGFATMELLEPDGKGPLPNRFGTYELVAFTKYDYCQGKDIQTLFNFIERKVCSIFTTIGYFSRQAVLNPKETCEIPNHEGEENTYLLFDIYQPDNKEFTIAERNHHLLLCMQVFKSEIEFSRANGSQELIKKLKDAGYYPYSDLDRQPVA